MKQVVGLGSVPDSEALIYRSISRPITADLRRPGTLQLTTKSPSIPLRPSKYLGNYTEKSKEAVQS